MRYGLNTKRLRRTLNTVVIDIDSSLAAVRVDFFGLAENWAEPVLRHLQLLIGDRLISACTDTQFQ
jgi:hypothetical protein